MSNHRDDVADGNTHPLTGRLPSRPRLQNIPFHTGTRSPQTIPPGSLLSMDYAAIEHAIRRRMPARVMTLAALLVRK